MFREIGSMAHVRCGFLHLAKNLGSLYLHQANPYCLRGFGMGQGSAIPDAVFTFMERAAGESLDIQTWLSLDGLARDSGSLSNSIIISCKSGR